MNIYEIMKRNESGEGEFSEGKINSLSELTGKTKDELFEIYQAGKQSNTPEGKPANWTKEQKLSFISENGHDEYKRLINERK